MLLVELLNINLNAFLLLHSQLEQRQWRGILDLNPGDFISSNSRFIHMRNSVLLAMDSIATRGLDITAVDHVIHYQIPRPADTYIRRNG